MPTEQNRFSGVRCLIFDLDGTLIDSKLDLALAVNAAVHMMGRELLDHERIFSYVGQGAQRLIAQALGPDTSPEDCDRALAFFLAYYREHMLDNTVAYPGVREGLESLEGMPMAVLTNKPVRISKRILEGLGLERFFRYVYGGDSFSTKKPEPTGIRTLLREFGASPKQTMLVGDSEIDVQTARNADTFSCSVTYGFGWERLADYPSDLIINSLAELPAHLDSQPAGRRG